VPPPPRNPLVLLLHRLPGFNFPPVDHFCLFMVNPGYSLVLSAPWTYRPFSDDSRSHIRFSPEVRFSYEKIRHEFPSLLRPFVEEFRPLRFNSHHPRLPQSALGATFLAFICHTPFQGRDQSLGPLTLTFRCSRFDLLVRTFLTLGTIRWNVSNFPTRGPPLPSLCSAPPFMFRVPLIVFRSFTGPWMTVTDSFYFRFFGALRRAGGLNPCDQQGLAAEKAFQKHTILQFPRSPRIRRRTQSRFFCIFFYPLDSAFLQSQN